MSQRLGIAALLVIATLLGANHVAARLAIDHGASVAAAVVFRSFFTALFLLLYLRLQRIAFSLERGTAWKAALVGALVAAQSLCLYASVARIPVALALLVFNLHPLLFMLLSWLTGKEKPRGAALAAMIVALAGLVLVLDVRIEGWRERWQEIGPGVALALAASVFFMSVLYVNAHWLKALDGRVRTFYMTAVAAALVLAGGVAADALAVPRDAAGWAGLALLTLLYGSAITALFIILPRLSGGAASTMALNFEPIAVLAIAWLVLGQAVSPTQVLGAFVVVGAIAWLSLAKR